LLSVASAQLLLPKAMAALVAAAAVACPAADAATADVGVVIIIAAALLQTSMPAWPSLATTAALLVLPAARTQQGLELHCWQKLQLCSRSPVQ